MWFRRKYTHALERLVAQFPAVLVTGPRQVGKTSLLKHHYPGWTYVSFDHPAQARFAETSPEEFLDSLQEPFILDEVQYVPGIFRHLKIRIDQRKTPSRFLLTGSQSFVLMEGVSESLAGRCGIMTMHSLSFEEVTNHQPDFSEQSYIVRGGYPELYHQPTRNAQDWYGAYVATYLERDLRNLRNVGDLRDFERFLRAVAARTGQLLSYSDLARDVGIVPNTAKQWVSLLRASGQVFLLEPYYRNVGKRLIKSPKLYLTDIGLACHLAGISTWDDVIRSPMAGALWETFVIGETLRYFHARGENPPLWFWQTSTGEEVDLLIEKGGRFIAVECKLTELPQRDDTKGLLALEKMYGPSAIERRYIACRTKVPFLLPGTDIKAIPAASLAKRKLFKSLNPTRS